MAVHPLGQQVFGEHAIGSGAGNTRLFSSAALGLTYSTQTPAVGMGITYNIQGFAGGTLLLTYWVVPPITTFSINGDATVPKPHQMSYKLPGMVGYDLSGVSVVQGYSTVVWQYERLLDADIAKLMSFYDPANPQVTITYPNELGIWTQKKAMMIPPQLGTRSTVVHSGVTFTFTHIIPD